MNNALSIGAAPQGGAASIAPAANTESRLPPALVQYWRAFLRWRWVVAAVVGGFLVAGAVVTFLSPAEYSATAQVQIDRNQKNVTNVAGLQSAAADRDLEFYETQYNLLKARTLAERVARVLKLGENDAFFAAHGAKLQTGTEANLSAARQAAKREERAVTLLLQHVSIMPVKNSRLVNIRYTSRDAGLSARIANAWAEQFIAASLDREFASTADARKFLEERLATLKGHLEQSEREAVSYATGRDIVRLEDTHGNDGKSQTGRTLAAMDLVALDQELARAVADRVQAESRMQRGRVDVTSDALSNPTIANLRQMRAATAAEYAKVRVQFKADYPPAVALAKQLDTLDAALAHEMGQIRSSLVEQYRQAVAREADLRRQVEALKSKLDREQHDTIQYNIYQREADTNRQLYDGLLQRYKEIGVSAGVGVNNIAIIDPADVPRKPSSPNLLLNMATALILGISAAMVLVLALEQIDEGIRDPDQVQPMLGLPMLGPVPRAERPVREEVADPASDLYESYFSIRSNLDFSTSHGFPRSLMLTSSRAAEGKSSSAFALASGLARTGKRTILIDGDLRAPSVHKFFDFPNRAGLANYLAGQDDWRALVHPVPDTGLSVITSGPIPPSAAELLSTERLGLLVDALLAEYDHLIVDAPALLGLSDAPLISRTVEGTVFVIEAARVGVPDIRAAMARLEMAHARLFGAILTKLEIRHGGYGYGYGYGYGRRYAEARG